MGRPYAYLAGGRLHVSRQGGPPEAFDSPFAESVRTRHAEIHRRHDWKTQGRGAQWSGLLWGGAPADPAAARISITSVARSREGGLVYAVDTGGLTGICALDAQGQERRLSHGNERWLHHLSAGGPDGRIACTVVHKDGTASIALMGEDATDFTELTEGDSQDQAPAWFPDGRRIVYQSAGLGRDRHGNPWGLEAFTLQELDLERGAVRTLAADPGRDLLGPKVAPDGSLHFIRRPYQRAHAASFGRAMLDFVLFPARLLYAIFQFLNFFTARYTGKPLTTAGGPGRPGADLRQMMVWGNLIDAQTAGKETDGDEPPAVVPRSWELVRQASDGSTEVRARSVLSFDLFPDGHLVYSTGSAVYLLSPDGRRERLGMATRIELVIAL